VTHKHSSRAGGLFPVLPVMHVSCSTLLSPAVVPPPLYGTSASGTCCLSMLLCRQEFICGTWLWGSTAARHRRFDPLADVYSLSMAFLEVSEPG